MASPRRKARRHLRTGKPFFSPTEDGHRRVGKILAKHGWNYDYDVGKTERGGWVRGKPNNPGYGDKTKPGLMPPGGEYPGLARQSTRKRAIKRNMKRAV